jgi:outer membrane protein assembly factor BamD (BamD/ComL family)
MMLKPPGESLGRAKSLLLIALLASAVTTATAGEAVAFATPALGVKTPPRHPTLEESASALTSSNLLAPEVPSAQRSPEEMAQIQLDLARKQRLEKQYKEAKRGFIALLEMGVPETMQKTALLELALISLDEKEFPRCQQIYAQYVSKWPQDPDVPEILFRQGMLYREMGLFQMALTKFYAVMTSSLIIKNDRFDFYQRLVLQAQTEIADTQIIQGKPSEAEQSLAKLLKSDSKALNRPRVLLKLVQALSAQGRYQDMASRAQEFLSLYPEAPELPEMRFLAASAYKQLGRNDESLEQVLLLLKQQQTADRDSLVYWQQKTGNDIGNLLYREGDFLKALDVFQALVALDKSVTWQIPVLYQVGLIYEHLDQPLNAADYYKKILDRTKEVPNPATPSIKAVMEMAKWRKDHLQWRAGLEAASKELRRASLAPSLGTAPELTSVQQ